MPSEVLCNSTPVQLIPASGKGALGTWRSQAGARTQSRGTLQPRRRDEPRSKPWTEEVYARQRLSLAACGKTSGGKPRSEPDSGNPTVRDRREAYGNVGYGGTRNPPHNRKGACRSLSTYGCAHRISIPTSAHLLRRAARCGVVSSPWLD